MLTAPSRDWNVFTQIFAEHWEGFTHAHPRYQTAYYDGLVVKMLACGNPTKMGSIEYRCLHCGQGQHLVAMSCKSSLTSAFAKLYQHFRVQGFGLTLARAVPGSAVLQLTVELNIALARFNEV